MSSIKRSTLIQNIMDILDEDIDLPGGYLPEPLSNRILSEVEKHMIPKGRVKMSHLGTYDNAWEPENERPITDSVRSNNFIGET